MEPPLPDWKSPMREPKRHRLKCWPEYYRSVKDGSKPFEVRKDDRDYQVGDILELNEWDPITGEYTGFELFRRVTYVLRDSKVTPLRGLGLVVMGIVPIEATPPAVVLPPEEVVDPAEPGDHTWIYGFNACRRKCIEALTAAGIAVKGAE